MPDGFRLTEASDTRITEAGVFRVTEKYYEHFSDLVATGTISANPLAYRKGNAALTSVASVNAVGSMTRYSAFLQGGGATIAANPAKIVRTSITLSAAGGTLLAGTDFYAAFASLSATSSIGTIVSLIMYGQFDSYVAAETRITEAEDTRITEAGDIRVTGDIVSNAVVATMVANGNLKLFTSVLYAKQGGTWKVALPYVKQNGVWVAPQKVYIKQAGIWTRIY